MIWICHTNTLIPHVIHRTYCSPEWSPTDWKSRNLTYFPFLRYTPNHSVHVHTGSNNHDNLQWRELLWVGSQRPGRCDGNTTVGRSQKALVAVKVTLPRISLCGCSIVWRCWECNIREITTCHTSVINRLLKTRLLSVYVIIHLCLSVSGITVFTRHTILSIFKLLLNFLSLHSNNSMKLQLTWKVACKFFNLSHDPKSSQKFINSLHFFSANTEHCSALSWSSVQFINTVLLTYKTFHMN